MTDESPFPADSHFGEADKHIDWRNVPNEEPDDDENDDDWAPGYLERHAAQGTHWTEKDFEDFEREQKAKRKKASKRATKKLPVKRSVKRRTKKTATKKRKVNKGR